MIDLSKIRWAIEREEDEDGVVVWVSVPKVNEYWKREGGNPYDNAKAKEVDARLYRDRHEAAVCIGTFIEEILQQAAPALGPGLPPAGRVRSPAPDRLAGGPGQRSARGSAPPLAPLRLGGNQKV